MPKHEILTRTIPHVHFYTGSAVTSTQNCHHSPLSPLKDSNLFRCGLQHLPAKTERGDFLWQGMCAFLNKHQEKVVLFLVRQVKSREQTHPCSCCKHIKLINEKQPTVCWSALLQNVLYFVPFNCSITWYMHIQRWKHLYKCYSKSDYTTTFYRKGEDTCLSFPFLRFSCSNRLFSDFQKLQGEEIMGFLKHATRQFIYVNILKQTHP